VSGQEFADHLVDLLGPLGPVSARRMFGGVGLFYGSSMFALIASEELYLKVDERNRADFEAEGEGPFAYETSGGRRAIMSYWRAPARLLDEPDELRAWARKSVDAALAAAKSKAPRGKRGLVVRRLGPSERKEKRAMTYTILGLCQRTGRLGAAVATYSLGAGGLCPFAVANAGVGASMAFVNPELRVLGANLLAAGHSAPAVVAALKAADPSIAFRQLGALDAQGRGSAWTGERTRAWAGHRSGPGWLALGNVLAGEGVLQAMARAYEAAESEGLTERLMRALEAGRDAGGQRGGDGHLPERSASLLTCHRAAWPEVDLRVDVHGDAVTALRAAWDEYRPYLEFHRLRHLAPASAPPQEAFVAELAGRRRN
jgi:uncharacterized Ntn-hydrolase superfamily protein/TfoX/Sxy family transcriptional regulator of competence genes